MSYHSSCLVKHFHFPLCDPIKIAGCSLPVNTLKQSWHSYAMSSSILSIFTPYLILGFFTNWIPILSWSLLVWLETQSRISSRYPLGEQLCLLLLAQPLWSSVALMGESFLFFWRMVPLPQHSPGSWEWPWVASGTWFLMLLGGVLVSTGINAPPQALLGRSRSEF